MSVTLSSNLIIFTCLQRRTLLHASIKMVHMTLALLYSRKSELL